MKNEPKIVDLIQKRGYRMTRQRRLVLAILQSSQEHLDADSLYSQAKKLDPQISLATVYRSLALLKENGFIEEHRLGQDHGHFEVIPKAPHYHFTCIRCGEVIEFSFPELENLASRLEKQRELQVKQITLDVRGLCAPCLKKDTGNEDSE